MTNGEFIESIRLEGEEWKDVEWNPRYAISSYGRAVAYSVLRRRPKGPYYTKPKLMKYKTDGTVLHYYMIVLHDGNGNRKCKSIHRLVAEAFIPNPHNYPIVNHKDENPHNNNVENLEWCTQQYNCNYGSHNLKLSNSLSTNAHKRKVVWLSANGEYLGTFNSIKEASEVSKASMPCIRICCKNPDKVLCGYKWRYFEDYNTQEK